MTKKKCDRCGMLLVNDEYVVLPSGEWFCYGCHSKYLIEVNG